MRSVQALLAAIVLAHPVAVHAESAVLPVVLANALSNPECGVRVETQIEFAPGSARVYSADRERLAELAGWWRAHGSSAVIAVQGFSGARLRAEDANLELSQRRADRVRRYLVRYGVDASHVVAVGLGSQGGGRNVGLALAACSQD
jgi:outer membrane protein OmpA-like peptidoglycan-associated protein